MKKFFTLVLVTVYGLLVTVPAQAAVSSQTRDYLRNATQTDWITMARVASGDTNVSTDHLRSSPGSDATDYERRILAIVAAGQDPTTFAGSNWLTRLGDFFDGTQMGAVGLLNDDAWGILAFRAAGVPTTDRRVIAPRDWLLNYQNTDGGWGFARTASSDTNDTAVVLSALQEAGVSTGDARLVRGFNYLKQAQRNDGGVGYASTNDPDTASTAWVATAFTKAGYSAEANRAQMWLDNQRLSDGSYRWRPQDLNGTPFMTAYAAIALANASFPVRGIVNNNPNNNSNNTNPPIGTRVSVDYRIEGRDAQFCQGTALAANPLDLLQQISGNCVLSLDIANVGLGQYVRGINGQTASGDTGWMYRVNWQQPSVGASDYSLSAGNDVLWYFGRFDVKPLRVLVDDATLDPGQALSVSVQFYSDITHGWETVPVNQVILRVADRSVMVDQANETINNLASGTWTVTAGGDGFVRPTSATIVVAGAPLVNPPINPPPSNNGSPTPAADTDNDGLTDVVERLIGTNPNVSDTDGDGYSDAAEVRSGYDPLSWVPCKVRAARHTLAQRQAIDQCWAAYTVTPTPVQTRPTVPSSTQVGPPPLPVMNVAPTARTIATGGKVHIRITKPAHKSAAKPARGGQVTVRIKSK